MIYTSHAIQDRISYNTFWIFPLLLPFFAQAGTTQGTVNSEKTISTSIAQTISIDYENYHQAVYTTFNDRTLAFPFDPAGFNINYGMTFDSYWSIQMGYGAFDDNLTQSNLKGHFENTAISGQLAYATSPWWFSLSYNQEEDTAQLKNAGNIEATIDENIKFTDITLEVAHEIIWDSYWLEAALSVEYQQQRSETRKVIYLAENNTGQQNEVVQKSNVGELTVLTGEGWLATIALNSSYLISITETAALIPSFSISWSESLSGSTHGSSITGIRSQGGNLRQVAANQLSEEKSEGSGQVNASSSLVIKDFTVFAGASLPFDRDFDGRAIDNGKRLYLGISYGF